ncbi:serpin family protein [Actinospica durhamensis]|uniref:Serpin family protein n=1 Tax=Actinospica durhamensis TaxID=1508375 RepID=A0A941EWE1_9ACTN|nr:serpin family protein [Actinospica durhamensis]MBR7839402.1 serpin family protein [Actinospica durhamensis]
MRGWARAVAVGGAGMLVAGGLAGCSSSSAGTEVPAGTSFDLAAHAAAIPVDAAQQARATAGSSAFAVTLLRALGAGGGDVTYSPQTLTDLLAMVLPGARGQTAAQVSAALGADGLTADQLAAALGADDTTAQADAKQGSITLRTSSDVWAANTLTPSQAYLSVIDGAFGAGMHRVDFAGDPESARNAVNEVVNHETDGYIPSLFGPGSITDQTRMVLTDALYLDAAWASPFDPNDTDLSGVFTRGDGSSEKTAMMSRSGTFGYASGSGWQLAQLPYQGGKLAMDVLLPASGTGALAALRGKLTGASLTSMLAALQPTSIALTMPRFTADSSLDSLEQVLKSLGITDLFDPGAADLSGLTADQEGLYVSAVAAKAHIAVGEKGTVAAAAAGMGINATSGRVTSAEFTVDHPFIYLIRDLTTGQILFMGQESSV